MKNLPKNPLDFIISLIPTNPEKVLAALLPKLRYIELHPVAAPTVAQIKYIRTLEPYSSTSISEIKRHLQGGTIKLGPFHRGFGGGTMKRSLEKIGLQVNLRGLTDSEAKKHGLANDDLPEYFKDK
jgi:hypothetical protein